MSKAKQVTAVESPPEPEATRLMVPLDSIFEDLANANVHDDADITGLMAKLATFGQVEPLVVQASTRKVIGGNGRLHAMRRLGWTECWVNLEDVDNVTATAMGIALNTRKSHFDEPTLAKHLRALQSEGFNLVATGFEDSDVDRMLERLAGEHAAKALDEMADAEVEPSGDEADAVSPMAGFKTLVVVLTDGQDTDVREAVKLCKAEKGLDTTPEALHAICSDYLAAKAGGQS